MTAPPTDPAAVFIPPFPNRTAVRPPTLRMQVHSPREDLRPWFLTLRDLDGPLDWPAFFGNDGPVEIDVGCGRGLFLYNESLTHPDRNYLGVEIDYREGRR